MTLEILRTLTDEQLNERFPFMVCKNVFSGEVIKNDETGLAYNHFEDWGWRDIQLAWAEHIKPIYDNFTDEEKNDFMIQQIKEKFGELRQYTSFSNEAIDLWTTLAEYVSSYTCIECGATEGDNDRFVYYESQGWISPYCEKHKKEDKKYIKKFCSDSYTFRRGIPFGPEQEISLKVEDFWKL